MATAAPNDEPRVFGAPLSGVEACPLGVAERFDDRHLAR